jgi:hypothetical protein
MEGFKEYDSACGAFVGNETDRGVPGFHAAAARPAARPTLPRLR